MRVQVSPSALFLQKLTFLSKNTQKKSALVVVLISNGPGEISTWVKPIANELHECFSMRPNELTTALGLRLILVPCPNSTGNEKEVARKWNLFELISPASKFWNFLLNPKIYGEWPTKGVVVFLGGDQFWSVLVAARLGYKHLTYAEWITRWPQWNDRIAARTDEVKNRLPKKYKNRCSVVGDLMADIPILSKKEKPLGKGKWIAIMPGSKKAKLSIGVPFLLEVADKLKKFHPEYNFLLPLAPTTQIEEIEYFISKSNPIAKRYKSKISKILPKEKDLNYKRILTNKGTIIHIHEIYPAYQVLSQCDLAITTVGANTSELASLGVPMIVIVPTQHLKVMQAWDGFLGSIARLPIIKFFLGVLISIWRLKNHDYLAWPNISAGKMIVPEKIGKIWPKEIALEAHEWLQSPLRLEGMKEDLRSIRGRNGATKAIVKEITMLIKQQIKS